MQPVLADNLTNQPNKTNIIAIVIMASLLVGVVLTGE
jgi:hypothetical protein